MKSLAILFVLLICTSTISAQNKPVTVESVQATLAKGKPYTLVILRKGTNTKELDSATRGKMIMDHLVHLFTMHEAGQLPVFGPVQKEGDIQGICIFNLTDEAEIKKLLDDDPFVKEGHIAYDMMSWFSIPGFTLPEK